MSRTVDGDELDLLAEQFQAFTGMVAPTAEGYLLGESDEDYETRREKWLEFCSAARRPSAPAPKPMEGLFE
jgi:hypothetical protein